MEEKKERDFAKEVDIQINKVEVETDFKDATKVKRIIFHADCGNITYKPTKETEKYNGPFAVKQKELYDLGEIPENIRQIAETIRDKGKAKVKASYNIWNTEKDGIPVTYRYIQYEKTMSTWKLITEEIQEEIVR